MQSGIPAKEFSVVGHTADFSNTHLLLIFGMRLAARYMFRATGMFCARQSEQRAKVRPSQGDVWQ